MTPSLTGTLPVVSQRFAISTSLSIGSGARNPGDAGRGSADIDIGARCSTAFFAAVAGAAGVFGLRFRNGGLRFRGWSGVRRALELGAERLYFVLQGTELCEKVSECGAGRQSENRIAARSKP
jgi:hypothetical protein